MTHAHDEDENELASTTSTPPDALPASKEAEAAAWREFDHETIDYVLRYGGRCRECADHHGLCPNGLPCDVDDAKTAIRWVLKALNYGISHGYLSNVAHPPTDAGVSEAVTDAMVERAWAVIVGEDIAATCFNANIVRGDLRAALSTAIPAGDGAPAAILDIASERKRQIEAEGWTPEHDDEHTDGSLAIAAVCYADPSPKMGRYQTEGYDGAMHDHPVPERWPETWTPLWWKPRDRRRNLVRAAALIAAEIERLDRISTASTAGDRK